MDGHQATIGNHMHTHHLLLREPSGLICTVGTSASLIEPLWQRAVKTLSIVFQCFPHSAECTSQWTSNAFCRSCILKLLHDHQN